MAAVRRVALRTISTVLAATLLFALLCLCASGVSGAKEKTARFSNEVAAGKWTGARFRNLPKGARLALQITVDGDVAVLLLNDQEYRALPAVNQPLFEGTTDDSMSFSIRVPETGDYYAVIDNRGGDTPRSFTIEVKAAADNEPLDAQAPALGEKLGTITDTLRKAFVFETLAIRAATCGAPKALKRANEVIVCAEFARALLDALGDRKMTADTLMFVLLHDVGHVLLHQWDHPFHGNETTADEFAAMLMLMFMGEQRVRSQSNFMVSRAAALETNGQLAVDDEHRLSAVRANRILQSVDDPKLVYNWQQVLVPRMQTRFLRQLEQQPRSWTARALVERELKQRE